MEGLTIQWVIWTFVGCVSAISGFACFFVSSTYKISFGKLGIYGLLSYILVCLISGCLILLPKRIPVSEKVKVFVGGILSGVIPSISVVYDKYVPGKSDAYAITAYGLFTLMSVSVSKKLEVGFETGFSAFFMQLFAAQLFKVKWFLLPITVVFSLLVSILRHYCSGESSQAESQSLPVSVPEDASIKQDKLVGHLACDKAPNSIQMVCPENPPGQPEDQGPRRRRRRMAPTLQNIPSSLEDTLENKKE